MIELLVANVPCGVLMQLVQQHWQVCATFIVHRANFQWITLSCALGITLQLPRRQTLRAQFFAETSCTRNNICSPCSLPQAVRHAQHLTAKSYVCTAESYETLPHIVFARLASSPNATRVWTRIAIFRLHSLKPWTRYTHIGLHILQAVCHTWHLIAKRYKCDVKLFKTLPSILFARLASLPESTCMRPNLATCQSGLFTGRVTLRTYWPSPFSLRPSRTSDRQMSRVCVAYVQSPYDHLNRAAPPNATCMRPGIATCWTGAVDLDPSKAGKRYAYNGFHVPCAIRPNVTNIMVLSSFLWLAATLWISPYAEPAWVVKAP